MMPRSLEMRQSVLIGWGHSNKVAQAGQLTNSRSPFSQLRRLAVRGQGGSVGKRRAVSGVGDLMCLHVAEGLGSSRASLLKGTKSHHVWRLGSQCRSFVGRHKHSGDSRLPEQNTTDGVS